MESMRSSRVRDARRWRIVAPLAAAAIAGGGAARADDGAADDGDDPPAATAPENVFGFDPTPRKPPPSCDEATRLACPRRDGTAPAAIETTLGRGYLRRLPVADGDAVLAASHVLGATRDDAGLSWSGASSLDNRWTLEGAPIDEPQFGIMGTRIPIDFIAAVRTRTAGFGARDHAALGATIDVTLREGGPRHDGEARAWLGAGRSPTTPGRVRGEFRGFEARYDDLRAVSAVGVIEGPLPAWRGAAAWYVVGVAPTVSDQTLLQRAYRRTDTDDDGVPDRGADGSVRHQLLAAQADDALGYSVPILARAGVRAGAHEVAVTALAHAGRDTTWRGIAEDSAAGVDRTQRDLDVVATWRIRGEDARLEVQAAWHAESSEASAHDPAGAGAPLFSWAFIPPPDPTVTDLDDRLVREGCADGGGDSYPMIENCPFPAGYYATGGAGLLRDATQERPSITTEAHHRLGEHLFAFGVRSEAGWFEDARRYTGGFERLVFGEGFHVDYRYVRLGEGPGFDDDCGGQPCRFLDRVATSYRTSAVAAWAQDTWRPDPRVAVEYGLRFQRTTLGDDVLDLSELLPRIAGAYDFLGGGRARLFVAWGRYAQTLPAALGIALLQQPTLMQTDVLAGETVTLHGGRELRVQDGAQGARVDEALAGVEVGLPDAIRLGASVRQRHLGRALELDWGVLSTAGSRGGTAATRDFTEVSTWLENAPDAKLGLRVGYAWSRLRGNWSGPYDPQAGYTLYASTVFAGGPGDSHENATGTLPNDRPHRFFAELALRGAWRGFAVEGGLRASAQSGRPIDARLGGAQTFAIPRGAAGRLPALTNANLHLAARRGRVTATLDVFNLFDRRAPIAVDDRYASGDSRPVSGGDRTDLVWLKNDDPVFADDGRPAAVNARHGEPTRYQSPITAFLGVGVDL